MVFMGYMVYMVYMVYIVYVVYMVVPPPARRANIEHKQTSEPAGTPQIIHYHQTSSHPSLKTF